MYAHNSPPSVGAIIIICLPASRKQRARRTGCIPFNHPGFYKYGHSEKPSPGREQSRVGLSSTI